VRITMSMESYKRDADRALKQFLATVITQTVDEVCEGLATHLNTQIIAGSDNAELMVSEVRARCEAAKIALLERYDLQQIVIEGRDGDQARA
jgi:hypothetical protein